MGTREHDRGSVVDLCSRLPARFGRRAHQIGRANVTVRRALDPSGKVPTRTAPAIDQTGDRGVTNAHFGRKGGEGLATLDKPVVQHEAYCASRAQKHKREDVPTRPGTAVVSLCQFRGMSNRLKALRLLRDLTQEELAEKVGVTHSTIQRIESGKRQLTEDMVMRLARALSVHPGELFAPMFVDDEQDQAAKIAATMEAEDREHWLATGRKLAGIKAPPPAAAPKRTG